MESVRLKMRYKETLDFIGLILVLAIVLIPLAIGVICGILQAIGVL